MRGSRHGGIRNGLTCGRVGCDGSPLVVTHRGLALCTAVGGDAVRQGGGVLAGDEDAADHEVELDWVEDAVAVVSLLGDCGEGLGFLLGGGVAVAMAGGRAACWAAGRVVSIADTQRPTGLLGGIP